MSLTQSTQSGATPVLGFHATSYPAGRRSAYNGGNPPSGSQFLQVGEAAQRTAHRNGVASQVEEVASKTATASPSALITSKVPTTR
nr:hypothetical protein [Dendronalium sp. ChiSLP03b]